MYDRSWLWLWVMNYVFRALLEREENKDSLVLQVSRWVCLLKLLPEIAFYIKFMYECSCFSYYGCTKINLFVCAQGLPGPPGPPGEGGKPGDQVSAPFFFGEIFLIKSHKLSGNTSSVLLYCSVMVPYFTIRRFLYSQPWQRYYFFY